MTTLRGKMDELQQPEGAEDGLRNLNRVWGQSALERVALSLPYSLSHMHLHRWIYTRRHHFCTFLTSTCRFLSFLSLIPVSFLLPVGWNQQLRQIRLISSSWGCICLAKHIDNRLFFENYIKFISTQINSVIDRLILQCLGIRYLPSSVIWSPASL